MLQMRDVGGGGSGKHEIAGAYELLLQTNVGI